MNCSLQHIFVRVRPLLLVEEDPDSGRALTGYRGHRP